MNGTKSPMKPRHQDRTAVGNHIPILFPILGKPTAAIESRAKKRRKWTANTLSRRSAPCNQGVWSLYTHRLQNEIATLDNIAYVSVFLYIPDKQPSIHHLSHASNRNAPRENCPCHAPTLVTHPHVFILSMYPESLRVCFCVHRPRTKQNVDSPTIFLSMYSSYRYLSAACAGVNTLHS